MFYEPNLERALLLRELLAKNETFTDTPHLGVWPERRRIRIGRPAKITAPMNDPSMRARIIATLAIANAAHRELDRNGDASSARLLAPTGDSIMMSEVPYA